MGYRGPVKADKPGRFAILVAATHNEGRAWRAHRRDLAIDRVVSTAGGVASADGARVTVVYVTPNARRRPRYRQFEAVLGRCLVKTGNDGAIVLLTEEDGPKMPSTSASHP